MVKWLKRLGVAVAALVALWIVTWAALPPLVRWQAPARLTALLGRPVTLGDVAFHPWALEMTLDDLQVGAAPGAAGAPLLKVGHVRANVALSSIFRRAPVIEAIDVDGLRLNVARLSDGHYDIDDLLQRFAAKPDAAPSEPTRFALYNLQVRDAQLRFDDRPVGRVHAVDALNLSLPFLSNLPANVQVTVQPRLAFRLNGARFDSAAQATPFAPDDHGTLQLALSDLDVRPYLGYLPDSLPLRVAGGALSADLALAFTQPAHGAPGVSLKGWVAARDLALTNVAGAPLLAWKQLRVVLGDVQPLARRLAFDSVRLEGLDAHVDRTKAGAIDALRQGDTAPRASTAPASAASAPAPAPASDWQVRVGAIDVVDGRVAWNDATTTPAAALLVDKLTLSTRQVTWPGNAATPFTLAADLGTPGGTATPAHLSLAGTAGVQDAKVDITLADLPLATLAPYLAQALVPRIDGTLAARATLDWSGSATAPRLSVALAGATLDGLRVQPAGSRGAAPAAFERLALADVRVDVPARSVTIADIQLAHPSLSIARDAQGRLDAAAWLRGGAPEEPAGRPAQEPASPPADATPPWHVLVRKATLADGMVQVADASLRRDPAAAPWRAELRQLQLTVQDFAWFGDHPVPPAKVQLSARVGGPRDAAAHQHAGELGWKGEVGLSPLAVAGNLRVVRFPVALVTPYVADRLPVGLLRAEAGYVGHLALKVAPAGLALSAGGDVLLGDVHLTTLPSATAATPDELLAWRSLSLKGLKFALAPKAAPRLDIGQIDLADLYARLVVTEQGRLNLQDVGAPSPAAGAASAPAVVVAASQPAPAASAAAQSPAMVINIGPTRLVNARIDYTDHFVRPNYSAALTELNGSLGAFSSASRDMAALQLHGRAEGTAILDIGGRVNPLATPLALDIQAKATDLELAPLSPYAGKYAGYAIERGKLSMDLAYRIDADGRLEASNRVVLNQLTFGDPIDSPSATKLPVRFAIALLKDRNGVIDIELPVSGSINDPQFSVGGIVVKLIVNLLVKAVTSPFSLLSGGGGGPDMSAIEFRPGSTLMQDSGKAALDKIAQALVDRPSLQLTITGSADPALERADYQRESVDAQLAAAARDDTSHATRSALLKALYKKTSLPDKPRVLGFAKDIPDAEMEALLRKNVAVGAETAHQLALARAIAVRDALVAKGVSIDRLFLAAPGVHEAGADSAGWTPRAALALATK
jgi:uncharacterized protein involved in outer membrane biogenesis